MRVTSSMPENENSKGITVADTVFNVVVPHLIGRLSDEDLSDSFADTELIEFMQSLGFEYDHNEGIADWFTKDEGTSELTVFGAREMMRLILAWEVECRIDEAKSILKLVPARDRHNGDSWARGYFSAQHTLRSKLKKRIAKLQSTQSNMKESHPTTKESK